MYLAGYAVECLLKTKLMHIYRCRTLRALEIELLRRSILSEERTVFTHRLRDLLKLAPGYNQLMQNREMLRVFREKVNQWTPNWRYSTTQITREEATEFMESVERFMHWVDTNI